MDFSLLFPLLGLRPLVLSLLSLLLCQSKVSFTHFRTQLLLSLLDFDLSFVQSFVDKCLLFLCLQRTFLLLLQSCELDFSLSLSSFKLFAFGFLLGLFFGLLFLGFDQLESFLLLCLFGLLDSHFFLFLLEDLVSFLTFSRGLLLPFALMFFLKLDLVLGQAFVSLIEDVAHGVRLQVLG